MIKSVLIFFLLFSTVIFSCKTSKTILKDNNDKSFESKLVYNLSNETVGEKGNKNISVILQFEMTHDFNNFEDEIDSDFRLEKHRKLLSENYISHNKCLYNELSLKDYKSYYLSQFGPFLLFKYENYDEFKKRDLSLIEKMNEKGLLYTYIEEENFVDTATRNDSNYFEIYPFEEALNDIGLSNYSFTGNGVKIGSIESGIPNNNVNLSNTVFETFGTNTTFHAFLTSSIYAGIGGIAKNSSIFFAALSNYSFLECVDWLLTKGVHIINRSNGGNFFTYSSTDAYADYVVKETKVTFINSAGNGGNQSTVVSPSVGLNVISVASSDKNFGISYFSSRGFLDNITDKVYKPNIAAPGGMISGIMNIESPYSGTSLSAPMATGITALLMEEFNDLKFNPEKVMSILCNSTNFSLGQIEEFDSDTGYGIINYEKARISSINSMKKILTNSINANSEVFSINVTIPFGFTIHAKTSNLYNSFLSNPMNNFDLSEIIYSRFRIELIDSNSNEIVSSQQNYGNFSHLSYSNSNPNSFSYRLKVYLLGQKQTPAIEHYSITYRISDDFDLDIQKQGIDKVDIPPIFTFVQTTILKYIPIDQYDLVFLNKKKKQILKLENIKNQEYLLKNEEWEAILNSMGNTYYVYIQGKLNVASSIKKRISSLFSFIKPSEYCDKIVVYPENYNFEQRYFFEEKTEQVIINNFSFSTKRLRTGYIEEEVVNLSPRRQGAGTAYLEYIFTEKIYRIDVDLSFWGPKEYINSYNATAYIQYKNNKQEWVTILDLLKDISLTTDRYNQNRYSIFFIDGTYQFRYYMTAQAYGTYNRGRISIGQTIIYKD